MKLNINQKGFTAIEGLLIFVIIGIIGGTGYYVYHANQKVGDTLGKGVNSSQTNPKTADKVEVETDPNIEYGKCLAGVYATPSTAALNGDDGSCGICRDGVSTDYGDCKEVAATYPLPKVFSPALIVGYSTLPSGAKDLATKRAKSVYMIPPSTECTAAPGHVVVEKIVDKSYVKLGVRASCGDYQTTVLRLEDGSWKVALTQHLLMQDDIDKYNLPKTLLD